MLNAQKYTYTIVYIFLDFPLTYTIVYGKIVNVRNRKHRQKGRYNMKLETLKERITGAEAKIAKKEATIQKKTEWIEKKEAQLDKLSGDKKELALWDIDHWKDDIKRLNKEIAETEKTLETYHKQLAGEIAKEEILLKDIPESVRSMQTELVTKWDEWDIERRNKLQADYKELGYTEFKKKYRNYSDMTFRTLTDEQIHNQNEQEAKALILDLYYRVRKITGEITDWSYIRATQGTQGMTVLNGIVIGKEGKCNIESILAGGYNIQRLHVRVLTHEI